MSKIKLEVGEEDWHRIIVALQVHADALETGAINLTTTNNPVIPMNLRGYVPSTRQVDLANKARQLAKLLLQGIGVRQGHSHDTQRSAGD